MKTMRDQTGVIPAAMMCALLGAILSCSEPPHSDGRAALAANQAAASDSLGEHPVAVELREHDAESGNEHGEREGREHSDDREHSEAGEHSNEEAQEEAGLYIDRDDVWDGTRGGAQLILRFEESDQRFVGSVTNVTSSTLCAVRVEVHLSTGTELGPTARADLTAGETVNVELPADGESFDTWTAHPETSRCGTP